jgi:hypothetical protein
MFFENNVLRKARGRNLVSGDWRRLHNEELNDLNCSPNVMLVI